MVGKTPKMSAQVVSAIRNLRDVHGSTSKQIMNYIMTQHNGTEAAIQRQMYAALKRGLEYGILKKSNGHYTLNTEADIHQLATVLTPVEKRGRRRGRRRKRRGRRRRGRRSRSRGRRRGRGRKRRRSRRRRSRRRRRGRRGRSRMAPQNPICEYCRSIDKKSDEDTVGVGKTPTIEELPELSHEEQVHEDRQNRRSKSRQRNRTRSRSLVNKDRGADD